VAWVGGARRAIRVFDNGARAIVCPLPRLPRSPRVGFQAGAGRGAIEQVRAMVEAVPITAQVPAVTASSPSTSGSVSKQTSALSHAPFWAS